MLALHGVRLIERSLGELGRRELVTGAREEVRVDGLSAAAPGAELGRAGAGGPWPV